MHRPTPLRDGSGAVSDQIPPWRQRAASSTARASSSAAASFSTAQSAAAVRPRSGKSRFGKTRGKRSPRAVALKKARRFAWRCSTVPSSSRGGVRDYLKERAALASSSHPDLDEAEDLATPTEVLQQACHEAFSAGRVKQPKPKVKQPKPKWTATRQPIAPQRGRLAEAVFPDNDGGTVGENSPAGAAE